MPATMMPEKHLLLERLAALRTRTRLHLAVDGIASTSLAFVTICLVSFGVDRVFRLTQGQRAVMLAVLGVVCAVLIWRRLVARLRFALPLVELARAVEKMAPELDWRLVSAVQFLENQDPRGSRELARLVVVAPHRSVALQTRGTEEHDGVANPLSPKDLERLQIFRQDAHRPAGVAVEKRFVLVRERPTANVPIVHASPPAQNR